MRLRIMLMLPLIMFLVILFFFWRGMNRDPNLLPSMLVDQPMLAFSAPSLEDNSINTASFNGKITLLNVWATWCDTCKLEQPFLMELAKNPNIQIFGLDYKDQRSAAINYLQKNGNPYRDVIYDATGKYAMQLGVYGTPETFLIDKKGIVRYRFVGAITLDSLEKDLLPRIIKMQKENV